MSDLYKIIGSTFFKVLSSRNRETYLDCLFLLHDNLDELFQEGQNTKYNVASIIEDYISLKIDTTIYDDDDSIINLRSNRDKANYMLNLFIKHKWLFEEDLGNYTVAVNFYNHSSRLLRTLREIESNDQTEYTGLISSIYFSLKNFSFSDIGQFEQIYKRTEELIANLKTLRSNIYLYYNDMIKNKSKENLQLLFGQLLDFKKNFFDKAFYNLYTKDTLKKYKYDIIVLLSDILNNDEAIESLTNLRMNDKYPTEAEARDFIIMKLHGVISAFENIDRLNHSIAERSEQYINALLSKIEYILHRSEDIEGVFNQIYSLIMDDKIDEYKFIKILDTKSLDRESLFTPRKIYERIQSSQLPFDIIGIDENKRQDTFSELMAYKKYSLDAINKYVLLKMTNNQVIKASELNLVSYDDYLYLILIYLYSKNIEAVYTVEKFNYHVDVNGIRFQNFKIMRKVK